MLSTRIGAIEVVSLSDGTFRLDGGAMFRVVPRALWERVAPPDERNRIALALRPLLVRAPGATVLVESGIGPLVPEKLAEQCAVARGPGLVASLREAGCAPEEIDAVVLSHLHFDHAGGTIAPAATGAPAEAPPLAAFPRARVVVQEGEWAAAFDDCPLCRASYLGDQLRALERTDRLARVRGDAEVAPGVRVHVTGGHTRDHQVVRIESKGALGVFLGDLVPTAAHLKPHWVMAYDLFPMAVYEAKRSLLHEMAERRATAFLYHDPAIAAGRVVDDGRDVRLEPLPMGTS